MSPLGHIAIALFARRAIKRYANTDLDLHGIVLGSILPDLDLMLLPFGKREHVHRTVGHSPLLVLIAAWLLSSRLPADALVCGGISHLLVDNFWGGDPPGVAWFFPFDRKRRLIGADFGMRLRGSGGHTRAVILELSIVLMIATILLIQDKKQPP